MNSKSTTNQMYVLKIMALCCLFQPNHRALGNIYVGKNFGKSSRTTKHSTQLGIRFIVSEIYIMSHCFGNGPRNTIKYPRYIAFLLDKIN